ncbi:hypothetical protein F5883DRAFT_151722 [Diaporthe sp. PMI_573]|nr:hypothetical protein F5883DRAFT_151722 [Diaporthaceae sp. PMI_573]
MTARPASFSGGHARNVPTVRSRWTDEDCIFDWLEYLGSQSMLGTVCACVGCVCVCVCVCVCAGECSSHFPQIYHGAPVRPHISTTQPAPVSSLSSAACSSSELELEGAAHRGAAGGLELEPKAPKHHRRRKTHVAGPLSPVMVCLGRRRFVWYPAAERFSTTCHQGA